MDKIEIVPTSYVTASMTPIKLSSSEHIETVFEAIQVDNHNNPKRKIKGSLVYKRFTKGNAKGSLVKITRRNIGSNEYVELSLDTEETYNLAKGLVDYFRLTYGKNTPLTTQTYVKEDEKGQIFRKILNENPELVAVLEKNELDLLNLALRVEGLKKTKAQIAENLGNNEEKFWQKLFTENTWILSQLFSAPYLFFQEQPYVGGKGIENSSGKFPDYLYKSRVTNNISIIEIKTPVASLVVDTPYRADVYASHNDLNGAVNQVLRQRDTLYKAYVQNNYNSTCKYEALNFSCILIIGNVAELSANASRLESFELFRNELKNIQIIGFDELLTKINIMIRLLEGEIE